jgi:dephospho-CoA kinase
MRVVATTGMPGSGKSLAVDVAEELGYRVVRMGDLVREEAKDRGLEPKAESFGQVASEVREKEGPGAWAKRTAQRVREVNGENVLVDGLRNLAELDVFREAFGDDVLVVAVLASPDTRHDRLQDRGRAEDSEDVQTLRERDRRELGYGLGNAIAMADAYVTNEGSPEEAREALRDVLATAD